jgi:hypothetical protein
MPLPSLFMHHIAPCPPALHHNAITNVWLISPIGHVYAELELEVSTKQVQVEDFTSLDLTQGKHQCI